MVDETQPVDVAVVFKRKPLSEVPLLWRLLARFVYFKIHWSSDYGLEIQGVYTDIAEGRHVASTNGWGFIVVPLNACLPPETCQYKTQDFPLSDASPDYRHRKFQFVAVPQEQVDKLQQRIDLTDHVVAQHRAAKLV